MEKKISLPWRGSQMRWRQRQRDIESYAHDMGTQLRRLSQPEGNQKQFSKGSKVPKQSFKMNGSEFGSNSGRSLSL